MASGGSDDFALGAAELQPNGPIFADDKGCRCALQEELGRESWRCIANATSNIYSGQSGKWLFATNQSNIASLHEPFNSDSNPPDNGTLYFIDDTERDAKFVLSTPQNEVSDLPDVICSGKNDTEASSTLYKLIAVSMTESLSPCWQPGILPLILQNASQWNATGCNLGFLCQNNTFANPPTYCPPPPHAQIARLAGGTMPPLGPYEPVVCEKGNYCPPGGARQIECPSDHFCSIGAYEPTHCSFGSHCPPGTYRERSVLPLIMVIALDLLLVAAVLYTKIPSKGRRNRPNRHGRRAQQLKKALTLSHLGGRKEQYLPIHNDNISLEARISGVRRANTSFLAAMGNDFVFDERRAIDDERSDCNIQQFVQSLSRCTTAASIGLSFKFKNLSYQPRGSSQPILSQVTGEIPNGSFWGVMGASGAGKSTFVNVLMGKHSHLGGITKINGSAGLSAKYKKVIGYVPQDDIVLLELTVRENILHSARMRLPFDWNDKDIQRHVDLVLECLQLSHVEDSRVGSTAAPVISGGERKRVSIGMELAAAPMALFLDEPTSGLDSTSASSIMTILKAVSRLGITVMTIIHQPRHEIFEALDSILLLSAGRVIYSGKEAETQAYFEDCGFSFPEGHNPADIIMDIIAGQGQLYKKLGDTDVSHLIEQWRYRQNASKATKGFSSPSPSDVEVSALNKTVKMRGAPWYRQTYFCLGRALLQQYRLRSSFYAEIGVASLAGLLLGLAETSEDGISFRGIFQHPYELLSSSVDYESVPEMSLLIGVACGMIASPLGVKIFG